ncbi:MAG TPA: CehA/McbA family metallohydrolase [Limnochordales bacterium]|nr:CehA/McbA family metallohydrolase [Limnochordales bacterium]
MQDGWHDKAGVIHVHSRYSDGRGSVEAIMRAAQRAGTDFLVLTDHDTLAPLRDGKEGWYGRTLLLVGTEVSPDDGNHYLGLGITEEVPRGLGPAEYVQAIDRQGGLGFIAHPDYPPPERYPLKVFPWTDWSVRGYTGMEIWTYTVDWLTDVTSVWRLAAALAAPGRFVSGPFPETLARWDALLAAAWAQGQRVVGIGSQDAHGILYSYRRMFRAVRTHILIAGGWRGDVQKDKALVLEALGAGRAFVANDDLHDARGFRFSAQRGVREVPMGGMLDVGDGAWLRVQAPVACRITLRTPERVVAEAHGDTLEQRVTEPGVYRVEARLWRWGRWRPWVFTNPVYLR